MSADQSSPLDPPIILRYRRRMTELLEALSNESRAFLSAVEELHTKEILSEANVLSAWQEFIAASSTSPAGVIFAIPTGQEQHMTTVLLEVLDAQLSQAAAHRGLAITLQYSVAPLQQGQPS